MSVSPHPPKKRYAVSRSIACSRCRIARSRCSHERPACSRCREYQYVCHYERDIPRAELPPSASTQAGPSDLAIAPAVKEPSPSLPNRSHRLSTKHELRGLLDAYFGNIYHIQAMSFLHRGQMLRQVDQGQVPPILLKAVCGLAARFLPGADNNHLEGGIQAAIWIQEAKETLITDTNRFSSYKLAAILCIIQHEFNCGRTASAWMFVAMAVRMAFALGLNVEYKGTQLSCVEREQRRRLMWATYCADAFSSSGWSEYSLLSSKDVQIHLPTDESSFLLGVERRGITLEQLLSQVDADPKAVDDAVSGNLVVRWIWLMKLRNDLLSYVRGLIHKPSKIWSADSSFMDVVRSLRRWKESLPASLEYTVDNLYVRQTTHELDSLVVLHLNFDSIHSTLYRITLPNFTESMSPDLLLEAPVEWLQQVRAAAYSRANAVQQKLELLEAEFPDHTPTTRLFNLYVLNSMRVQLQFLALHSSGPNREVRQGLQVMADIVGKMTNYFCYNRRVLRDVLRILIGHGYDIETSWDYRMDATSGARTPNDVSGALSGFPCPPGQQSDHPGEDDSVSDGRMRTLSDVVDVPDPVSDASKAATEDLQKSTPGQLVSDVLHPPVVPVQAFDLFTSPSDLALDFLNTSSDPLSDIPELWNPIEFETDFTANATQPPRTIADANASPWTVDTNFYFWGMSVEPN